MLEVPYVPFTVVLVPRKVCRSIELELLLLFLVRDSVFVVSTSGLASLNAVSTKPETVAPTSRQFTQLADEAYTSSSAMVPESPAAERLKPGLANAEPNIAKPHAATSEPIL